MGEVTTGDLIHQIKPVQSGSESYLVHDIFDRKYVFALPDSNVQESGLKPLQSVYEENRERYKIRKMELKKAMSKLSAHQLKTLVAGSKTKALTERVRVKVARSRRRRRVHQKGSPKVCVRNAGLWINAEKRRGSWHGIHLRRDMISIRLS